MASASSLSCAAFTSSSSCSRLVALAIGAVTLGRAINQAKATCAGVACSRFRLDLQRIHHAKPFWIHVFFDPAPARTICEIAIRTILAA